MEAKDLLTEDEYYLYGKLIHRNKLRIKRRKIEKSLQDIMEQLDECSDINIGKGIGLTKAAIWVRKSTLSKKCKRLKIDLTYYTK